MSHNHENHSESHFYRGLIFGAVLGIGLVYFLKTKEGQKVKRQLLGKGEELLEDFSEQVIEFLDAEPSKP
jgi:hypothetical protein